jgi:hypothetical protein
VNFSESVEAFVAEAYWLDASQAPSVVALQALAIELDREVTAALVAQFGVLHRSLLKSKPTNIIAEDPMEKMLRR